MRQASINGAWIAFTGSGLVIAALVTWLAIDRQPSYQRLNVYCAAALRKPVEAATRDYEKAYGVSVILEFGASQTLLAKLELDQRGDLFLPADDSYLQLADQKQLLTEARPLAVMTPVIAVRAGNPKGIRALADLLHEGVRLAQANPEAAAIGHVTREALRKTGDWDALERRTMVFKPTVTDVVTDVRIGTVDAGIVWDGVIAQLPDLEAVHVAPLDKIAAHVSVGILRGSPQLDAAARFAKFLSASDRGLTRFTEAGFRVVDSVPWQE